MADAANVLMTAPSRRREGGVPVEFSGRGIVVRVNRLRAGTRGRVQLSWPSNCGDFNRYLLSHYRAYRRADFDVDLGDGRGAQTFHYAAPPQLSANHSGAGTYTVTIERSDVR